MVDVLLSDVGVEILALDEAQEELIDNLNVRPSNFKNGLILLGVEGLALGIHGRRDRAEEILGEHFDDTRIHALRDDLSVVGDVIEQLVQGQALDFLGLHISTGVIEVEDDVALIDFLHEEFLPLVGCDLVEPRELLQFAFALVGDVETRRVLPLGRANSLSNIFRGGLQAIEEVRLAAGLGGEQISRHRLGGSGRGYVLSQSRSVRFIVEKQAKGGSRVRCAGLGLVCGGM